MTIYILISYSTFKYLISTKLLEMSIIKYCINIFLKFFVIILYTREKHCFEFLVIS